MPDAAAPLREAPGTFSRAALLFGLLVGVVQRYEPEVAAVLREERTTAGSCGAPSPVCSHPLRPRASQAQRSAARWPACACGP